MSIEIIFFFQAEDGIRDSSVTGVQTCALPIFYAQRVRELLDQYVAAAHGKIRLEVYNPLPFSDVEDRAVAFGLQGVPLDVAGAAGYFRPASPNPRDHPRSLPFFQAQRAHLLE